MHIMGPDIVNWTPELVKDPWEINPDLQKDRIVEIASFIAEVRAEVIDRHEPELGDTRLSLGMRCYECCRTRLIYEDQNGTWPYFSVLTPTGRFTFRIGDVPVRFVRNDPDDLPGDKLVPSNETAEQMSFFPDDYRYASVRWFIVFDTFYKNVADNLYFVGYDEGGEIVSQWEIPLETGAPILSTVSPALAEAVEIDEVVVKPKQIAPQAEGEATDG